MLELLVKSTRKRVEEAKGKVPFSDLVAQVAAQEKTQNGRVAFAFEKNLKQEGISFICEVKKASPSKGIIAPDFPYLQIALEYEKAGAQAVSVLTEPEYFLGNNKYLADISRAVSIPVLRKDFIIDAYQLYEAKLIGADAVLLICTLLDLKTLKKYLQICDALGLSALVEVHTKEEIAAALAAGARVIGVNNRNLQTFTVDLNRCLTLRELVPREIVYVAESGIQSRRELELLEEAGVDAVLIGEALMKSKDKTAMLAYLQGKRGGIGDKN
ncbi:MAG: indole-3-glycerol phosphate synthase TrpC [Firmicutes bacterium]|nr:indole-3-glycerol phosphate synthase TrpC [Bacillota bacterium]